MTRKKIPIQPVSSCRVWLARRVDSSHDLVGIYSKPPPIVDGLFSIEPKDCVIAWDVKQFAHNYPFFPVPVAGKCIELKIVMEIPHG